MKKTKQPKKPKAPKVKKKKFSSYTIAELEKVLPSFIRNQFLCAHMVTDSIRGDISECRLPLVRTTDHKENGVVVKGYWVCAKSGHGKLIPEWLMQERIANVVSGYNLQLSDESKCISTAKVWKVINRIIALKFLEAKKNANRHAA
jgi:hypothetical protein